MIYLCQFVKSFDRPSTLWYRVVGVTLGYYCFIVLLFYCFIVSLFHSLLTELRNGTADASIVTPGIRACANPTYHLTAISLQSHCKRRLTRLRLAEDCEARRTVRGRRRGRESVSITWSLYHTERVRKKEMKQNRRQFICVMYQSYAHHIFFTSIRPLKRAGSNSNFQGSTPNSSLHHGHFVMSS